MAEETTGKCAHGACDCPPEEGSKYCSEYCREAEKIARHGNRLRMRARGVSLMERLDPP